MGLDRRLRGDASDIQETVDDFESIGDEVPLQGEFQVPTGQHEVGAAGDSLQKSLLNLVDALFRLMEYQQSSVLLEHIERGQQGLVTVLDV